MPAPLLQRLSLCLPASSNLIARIQHVPQNKSVDIEYIQFYSQGIHRGQFVQLIARMQALKKMPAMGACLLFVSASCLSCPLDNALLPLSLSEQQCNTLSLSSHSHRRHGYGHGHGWQHGHGLHGWPSCHDARCVMFESCRNHLFILFILPGAARASAVPHTCPLTLASQSVLGGGTSVGSIAEAG